MDDKSILNIFVDTGNMLRDTSNRHKAVMPTLETPAYGNYVVLHPNGNPMFRCNEQKAQWYISRGLAEITSKDADSIKIKLNFVPKGYGHHGDDFYLGERENICVVCGGDQDLTKHHIVPYHYRRVMPEEVKSRNFHDVVLLCDPCHREYEEYARILKESLAEQYHAPLSGKGDIFDRSLHMVKKAASAISMFGSKLPEKVLQKKYADVTGYLGHEPTEQEISDLSLSLTHDMTNHKRHGEIVVEKVQDIQKFVEMWRYHFLDNMNPKFMPKHWNPKRPCADVGRGRKCTESALE